MRAMTLRPEITGRRVLFGLLGFFGLVIAMNGVFVWVALSSFSGVTSKTAYVEGLAYNATLAAAEAQKQRGWSGDLDYRDGRLVLTLVDARRQPVTGLTLSLTTGRPATRIFDSQVPLPEVAPGRYAAAVDLAPGQWQASIAGEGGDGAPFRTEERLWVR